LYATGASLAQDRGRLEAKIETQVSEISMLKKQLEVGHCYLIHAVVPLCIEFDP